MLDELPERYDFYIRQFWPGEVWAEVVYRSNGPLNSADKTLFFHLESGLWADFSGYAQNGLGLVSYYAYVKQVEIDEAAKAIYEILNGITIMDKFGNGENL